MIYQKPAFLGLIAYPGLIFWDKLPNHTMLPCISYGKKVNKKRQTTKCKTLLLLSYTCYSYMVKRFSKDFYLIYAGVPTANPSQAGKNQRTFLEGGGAVRKLSVFFSIYSSLELIFAP